MALKIRLRQQGRTNRKVYRLVVAEATSARDGRYVEMLGWYNPHETEMEKQLNVEVDRVQHWLNIGAEMSERSCILIQKAAPDLIKSYNAKRVAKVQAACAKRKKKRA